MTLDEVDRKILEFVTDSEEPDILWSGLVDGRFYVANLNGWLSIWDESGVLLYDRLALPEYPTEFGPDIADVQAWMDEATVFIDEYEADEEDNS